VICDENMKAFDRITTGACPAGVGGCVRAVVAISRKGVE
jgi:hypothetical protein